MRRWMWVDDVKTALWQSLTSFQGSYLLLKVWPCLMNEKKGEQFTSQFKTLWKRVRKLTEGYKSAVQHAKFDCVRYRRETGRCGACFLLFRFFNVHIPRLGSTKATSKSKVSESRLRSKRKERKTLLKAEAKRGSSLSRVSAVLLSQSCKSNRNCVCWWLSIRNTQMRLLVNYESFV